MSTPKAIPSIEDWHVSKRAEKRIGLKLTPADVAEIWSKIDSGRAIRLHDGKRNTVLFVLTVRGRACRILVNPKSRRLITLYERPGKMPSNRRLG